MLGAVLPVGFLAGVLVVEHGQDQGLMKSLGGHCSFNTVQSPSDQLVVGVQHTQYLISMKMHMVVEVAGATLRVTASLIRWPAGGRGEICGGVLVVGEVR